MQNKTWLGGDPIDDQTPAELENPTTSIPPSSSVDGEAPSGERSKSPTVSITVDEAAFKAGFEFPFDLTFRNLESMKRGDLLTAVVEAWGSCDQRIKANFRRWCCKMLNMAESAFNSPEALGEAVSMVENDIMNKKHAIPRVEPVPESFDTFILGSNEGETDEDEGYSD